MLRKTEVVIGDRVMGVGVIGDRLRGDEMIDDGVIGVRLRGG